MKEGELVEAKGKGEEKDHPRVIEVINLLDDDDAYLEDMQEVLGSLCPTPAPGSPPDAGFFESLFESEPWDQLHHDAHLEATPEMSPIANLLKEGVPDIATLSEEEDERQIDRLLNAGMNKPAQTSCPPAASPTLHSALDDGHCPEGNSARSGSGEIMALWGESLQELLGETYNPDLHAALEKDPPHFITQMYQQSDLNRTDSVNGAGKDLLQNGVEARTHFNELERGPCPANLTGEMPTGEANGIPRQELDVLQPPYSCPYDPLSYGLEGLPPNRDQHNNYQDTTLSRLMNTLPDCSWECGNPQLPDMRTMTDLLNDSLDTAPNGLANALPGDGFNTAPTGLANALPGDGFDTAQTGFANGLPGDGRQNYCPQTLENHTIHQQNFGAQGNPPACPGEVMPSFLHAQNYNQTDINRTSSIQSTYEDFLLQGADINTGYNGLEQGSCPNDLMQDRQQGGANGFPLQKQHPAINHPNFTSSNDPRSHCMDQMYSNGAWQGNNQGNTTMGSINAAPDNSWQYCAPQFQGGNSTAHLQSGLPENPPFGAINQPAQPGFQQHNQQIQEQQTRNNQHYLAQTSLPTGSIDAAASLSWQNYGNEAVFNLGAIYGGKIHEGIPVGQQCLDILNGQLNTQQNPQQNLTTGLQEAGPGHCNSQAIGRKPPRRKRGRATDLDESPLTKKRPDREKTTSDAIQSLQSPRVAQGVVINPTNGQEMKLGPAANVKMRNVQIPAVSKLFADITSKNPSLSWMTRQSSNMVDRCRQDAMLPQMTRPAGQLNMSGVPQAYTPYKQPDLGAAHGIPTQNIHPGLLVSADGFPQNGVQAPDAYYAPGMEEFRHSPVQDCALANQTRSSARPMSGGGVLGGVLKEASAAFMRKSAAAPQKVATTHITSLKKGL